MIELVVPSATLEQIEKRLLGEVESCAVLLANQVQGRNSRCRLLVDQVLWAELDDYSRQGKFEAELTPAFVAKISKVARNTNRSIIFCHSHPGSSPPKFSKIDDAGEEKLGRFLAHRVPDKFHCATVVSKGGWAARKLGEFDEVRLISLGDNRRILTTTDSIETENSSIFDRQVRVFGEAGQKELGTLHVAIVGLGGTGSIVAQQLAHLGVREFTLIDPDAIEPTNLNRVVGATPASIGKAKVEVAKDAIHAISNSAKIETIRDDICERRVTSALFDADLIMGCTDSHGSRSVIQQVAYQYLIPCIDLGAVIVAQDGIIKHIGGRVQLLSPGRGCLVCSNLLDSEQVRRDLMDEVAKRSDPYIVGHHEPAPAVISLNGTVSSLAITMVLNLVLSLPGNARHLLYNEINSTLRHVKVPPQADCYICSAQGSLAKGNSWPIFARDS